MKDSFGTLALIILGIVAIICIIGVVVEFFVPVPFEDVFDEIIRNAAFDLTTIGMSNHEIYTNNGKVREKVRTRVAEKRRQIRRELVNDPKYLDELFASQLIDEKRKIKKRDLDLIEEVTIEYLDSKREKYKQSVFNDGFTVNELFNLKNIYKGDFVGVYILYNSFKNMAYVGQAKKTISRATQHFLGKGNPDVYYDYRSGDQFYISMIKLSDSGYSDIDKLEKDMIVKYDAYTNGYNRNQGNG